MILKGKYIENCIFFINDLVLDNNTLFSYEEFEKKYNIKTNFVEFYGILSAIPNRWKSRIEGSSKLDNIENKLVDKVKKEPKSCKFFYNLFLEDNKVLSLSSRNKWEIDLNIQIEDWNAIYSMPFIITRNSFLQNFQFKIVHRILPCNSFLYKCKLKETELCTFCSEVRENIFHIFWECNVTQNFWFSIIDWIRNYDIFLPFSAKEVILGVSEDFVNSKTVNNILLLLKYYIYKCRCKSVLPTKYGGIEYLKYWITIEKYSVCFLTPTQKIKMDQKWQLLEAAFN